MTAPAREPVATVGVPVYNGARFLREALERLRAQHLHDIEVVICDNCSTDSTPTICAEFVRSDPRFRYYRNERNLGMAGNFNRTLALARAPLFMWNAYDDGVEPEHLSRCQQALAAAPEAVLAFSEAVHVDACGQLLGNADDAGLDFSSPRPAARVHHFLDREVYTAVGWGAMIRTDVLRAVGGHPSYHGADVVLGMSLAMRGPFVQVPHKTFRIRMHDAQTNKLQGATLAEQIRAFSPDRHATFAFPQWRLNLEMYRLAVTADLGVRDRWRCLRSVTRLWTVRHWRFLPHDVKRNLQTARALRPMHRAGPLAR